MRTNSRSCSTSTERGALSVSSSGLAASWLTTVPRRRTRPRALENSIISFSSCSGVSLRMRTVTASTSASGPRSSTFAGSDPRRGLRRGPSRLRPAGRSPRERAAWSAGSSRQHHRGKPRRVEAAQLPAARPVVGEHVLRRETEAAGGLDGDPDLVGLVGVGDDQRIGLQRPERPQQLRGRRSRRASPGARAATRSGSSCAEQPPQPADGAPVRRRDTRRVEHRQAARSGRVAALVPHARSRPAQASGAAGSSAAATRAVRCRPRPDQRGERGVQRAARPVGGQQRGAAGRLARTARADQHDRRAVRAAEAARRGCAAQASSLTAAARPARGASGRTCAIAVSISSPASASPMP